MLQLAVSGNVLRLRCSCLRLFSFNPPASDVGEVHISVSAAVRVLYSVVSYGF
jgi:hypothetical protein